MKPVIAIIGRPNVGKSTLFNCLTRSRDALVADIPGLTRDRKYGEGQADDRDFIVIDTGGLGEEEVAIDHKMAEQSQLATQEADAIIFVVDGRAGLTPGDQQIAKQLRPLKKPIYLAVNKTDGVDPDIAAADFYQLGLPIHCMAAAHRRGVMSLISQVLAPFPKQQTLDEAALPGIRIAIVGRPNVGKSTLVNRMLGEERVVVFDMPGTTRDSIYVPMQRLGQDYVLIDTAGVRRKARVEQALEKFSVIKTLQSIEEANVCIVMVDAREGITEQDLHLIGFILDAGKAIVLAVNKWDNMTQEDKDRVRVELDRRLTFLDFAKIHFISALHGTAVGDLFPSVEQAYQSAMKKIATPELTRVLEDAVTEHQPPLVRGRRIKLRYAHFGGNNPPIIVIHGNQTDRLPDSYKRYLINRFRKVFKLVGTPIRLQLVSSDNPYKGRRNKLTPRQMRKRKRVIKQHKKK